MSNFLLFANNHNFLSTEIWKSDQLNIVSNTLKFNFHIFLDKMDTYRNKYSLTTVRAWFFILKKAMFVINSRDKNYQSTVNPSINSQYTCKVSIAQTEFWLFTELSILEWFLTWFFKYAWIPVRTYFQTLIALWLSL